MARMRKTKASNKQKAKTAKKAQINRRAAYTQDLARSGQLKNKKGNIATGGESTGRESGIIASQQKSRVNKIKGLEQSVGSLDRRIQNALDNKDTDTAKDLRSRLNKFTDKLGYERAILHDGVMRNKDGKILRSTSGNPLMNTRGREVFDETKDQDFIDPTRKLRNIGGDAYGTMYPGSDALQKGLKYLFKDYKKRPSKYNLEDMPGVRYPLDEDYGKGEGPTFFGGRSRDPNYKQPYFSVPDTDVSISDFVAPQYYDTGPLVPKLHPAIDPNTRSEIMNEGYEDIIESGRQDYETLFSEWEKNKLDQELLKNINPEFLDKDGNPIDPVKMQELEDLLNADLEKQKAFAKERQNKFYNKDGIEVGGEGNLWNTLKELYNLGGYLSGGQLLNKYVLEPGANALLGENQMVPIDQSEFNPEKVDYSQITETLKGPKYNLKDDQIEALLNYNPNLLDDSDINSTLADFYSQ